MQAMRVFGVFCVGGWLMICFAKVLTTKIVPCFAIIVLQDLLPLDISRIVTRYGM